MIYRINQFIKDWLDFDNAEEVINKIQKSKLHKEDLEKWFKIYRSKKNKLCYEDEIIKTEELQLLIILENKFIEVNYDFDRKPFSCKL